MTEQQYKRLKTVITNVHLDIKKFEQAWEKTKPTGDKAMLVIYEVKQCEKMQQICNLWFVVTGEHKSYMTIIKILCLDKKGT